ncbi:MAG: hypothetical protein JWP69_258 [Flaviaesturariibacter sp.]|nr:hypothetical protein [Flaviaesturariibacter sp.]
MRKSTLLLSLVLISVCSVAAPKIKLKINNGNWKSNSTWDLNRVPANTDTVFIPAGNVVIIDDHQNLGSSKLIVMVYGTLQFVGNGKLTLDANSAVFVQSGGIVDGSGSSAQKLRIGDQQLSGTDIQIAASQNALLLTATSNGYEPVSGNSGFGAFQVLPVKISSFSLAAKSNAVLVQWTTAQEQNSKHFEIERSSGGTNWTVAGTVSAAGNSTHRIVYNFTDVSISSGMVYYRVKQVDTDGRFGYTTIRSFNKNDALDVRIISAYGKLSVQFSQEVKGSVEIRLISISGRVVSKETLHQPVGQVMVDKHDQKGYYVMIVTNFKDINIAQKVNL